MHIRRTCLRSLAFWIVIFAWHTQGWTQKRMIPHLTRSSGGFTSQVVLSNLTAVPRTYRLLGFDQEGLPGPIVEGTLEPVQTVTRETDEFFGMNLSHFEVDSADNIAISIIYKRDRQDTGPAHVHESAIQATTWRVFPGNDTVTWDGLAAVNTGATATDITIVQKDANGQILNGPQTISTDVPPNSKVLYLFSQDFPSITNTSFDVSAEEPLALVALRGNIASDYLWENKAIPLHEFDADAFRIIPHVTSSNGGFRSQIIVSNPFETEKSYGFAAYDRNGNQVMSIAGSVAPGNTLYSDADDLLGAGTSHVEIVDSTETLVSISYQKDRENAGPAQVHDLSQTGTAWRIYPGDPSVTWDGLAAVNQGSNASDVVVWQVDEKGSLIRGPIIVIDQLQADAKGLYVFSADFDNEPNAFFEVTASEPLAVMALRGNQDSDFIWENGAIPLPESGPKPAPPRRIDYAIAFDTVRRAVIMVGGFDENFDLLEDTWLWNGRRWRQVVTETSPLPRSHHGGAFDGKTNQMVIFGGFKSQTMKCNDFMVFDGTAWADFAGDAAIPAEDGELVYDEARRVLVLTVSNGNSLQTWEYDDSQWALKNTPTNPGKRIDQGFVYDSERQKVVMFGGLGPGNQFVDETWEYDGVDWTRNVPATSPPALAGMAMFYDSVRKRTVLFGGMDGSRTIRGETWEYDGSVWSKLDPDTAPESRWVAFAAFDPKRGVATLFGGEGQDGNGLIMYGDTWEFDGTNWHKR